MITQLLGSRPRISLKIIKEKPWGPLKKTHLMLQITKYFKQHFTVHSMAGINFSRFISTFKKKTNTNPCLSVSMVFEDQVRYDMSL